MEFGPWGGGEFDDGELVDVAGVEGVEGVEGEVERGRRRARPREEERGRWR